VGRGGKITGKKINKEDYFESRGQTIGGRVCQRQKKMQQRQKKARFKRKRGHQRDTGIKAGTARVLDGGADKDGQGQRGRVHPGKKEGEERGWETW